MSSSKKKHVALFYGHVASNLGDLAINAGALELLKSQPDIGHVTVVLLDAAKSDYLDLARRTFASYPNVKLVHFQSHGEKALRFLFDPAAFLEETETSTADLILLAAGEHLFNYVEVDNKKPLFWRTLPAFVARATGIPCALLPSTLGPFESPEAKALFREIACCLDQVAVRDSSSREIIKADVESKRLSLLPDPAFMCPLSSQQTTGNAHGPAQRVALVMRAERVGIRLDRKQANNAIEDFRSQGYRNSQAYEFSMALCSELLEETSHTVDIFVQTDADRLLAEHIVRDLNAEDRLSVYRPSSVDDYVDHLMQVDQVVASRFHAIVLALRIKKPVFGLYFSEHGHKMPGLFNALGMSGQCFRLSDASATKVAVEIREQMSAAGPELEVGVIERIDELMRLASQWMGKLVDLRRVNSPDWPREAASALGVIGQHLAGESVRLVWQKKIEAASRSRRQEKDSLLKQLSALEAELKKERGYRDGRAEQLSDLQAEVKEMRVNADEIRRLMTQMDDRHASVQAALEIGVESQRKLMVEIDELKATRARLESDLENARAGLERSRSEATEKTLEADEKSRQAELLGAQVSSLKTNLAYCQESVQQLKDQLSRSKALAERKIANLERRALELQTSVRYRLGSMISQGFHRPRMILGWPQGALSLYRESRPRKSGSSLPQASKPAPAKSVLSAESSRLIRRYEEGGIDRILADLRKPGESDRSLALNLINVGKDLETAGCGDAALALAAKALEIDRSVAILRGYFWAAQNAGQLEDACSAIMEIEERLGKESNRKEKKRLQQLQRSASYQLSMARQIPQRTRRTVVPRGNRVCYVLHNSLPYSSGGYATRTHGLSLGLSQAGYEVHAITRPGYPCDIVADLSDSDVPLHEVIDGIHYHRFLSPRTRQGPVSMYVQESANHLEELFRELQPRAVIAASNHRVGIMSLVAARRLGIPFIYEVRGWWEITRQSRDPDFVDHPSFKVQKQLETVTCIEADLVYTLTNAMRDELVDRGIGSEKIRVLPNSCDTTRFSPRQRDPKLARNLDIPDDVPVIGYVGTFVDYEGLEILAVACGILRQQRYRFRLLLVGNENASGSGSGPISEEIVRLAKVYDFHDWLIMPGRVPHEDVESFYSLIDIAPFPRKPWPVCEMVSPMKPLEALAMQKAVVVSSVAALQEMIKDGETGVVFRKGSAESLAEKLAMLILRPTLRDQFGEAGRAWVERERNWNRVARMAIDGIQELTS